MRSRRWFAAVPLLWLSLSACAPDNPALEWLLNQQDGPNLAPA